MAFKANKTILGYASTNIFIEGVGKSQSKLKLTNSADTIPKSNQLQKQQQRNSTHKIYQAIMSQIGSDHNQYINKLIDKFDKKYGDTNHKETNFGHERAKSYANILLDSDTQKIVSNEIINDEKILKLTPQNGRNSHKTIKNHKEKYMLQYKQTPSTFCKYKEDSQTQIFDQFSVDNPFLLEIDKYVKKLESKPFRQKQIKNFMKNPSQQSKNNALIQKLQSQQIKIKQLRMKYHLSKLQQATFAKKQKVLKEKIFEMHETINYLKEQLANQRQEKQTMQSLLSQFQERIKRFKPQRKTIGYRSPKNRENYLSYDFTDQLEQKNQIFQKDNIQANKYKWTQALMKNDSSKKFKKKSHQFTHQQINDFYNTPDIHALELESQNSSNSSSLSQQ